MSPQGPVIDMHIRGFKVDNSHRDIPLEGPLAKLERAHEHLEALRDEVRSFFESNVYSAPGEIDPQTGWHRFRLQAEREPTRIGVLIGDFVHQVRPILDHLAYAVARWEINRGKWGNGIPRASRCRFLIETNENEFKRRRDERGELKLLPDDWQQLIERVQPYHRHHPPQTFADDAVLAILDKLWNTDKHETVITASVGQASGISLDLAFDKSLGTFKGMVGPAFDRPIYTNSEIARARIDGLPADSKVYLDGTLSLQVHLVEALPPPQRRSVDPERFPAELFETLWRAGTFVQSLLLTFPRGEPRFPIEPPPEILRGFPVTLQPPSA